MAESILTSLVPLYAKATRMEERSSWRHPIDLNHVLERSFKEIPVSLELGRKKRGSWRPEKSIVDTLLSDKPNEIADVLLTSMREGATEEGLAAIVEYAAALRIAFFGTSNEFSDWNTAHHTFTFSHAVQQSLHRLPSIELLRGIFDAAMSVYLNRFLNVPPSPIPTILENSEEPDILLKKFLDILDKRQQVKDATEIVVSDIKAGGDEGKFLSVLGKALLREDRNFHSIQMIEATCRRYKMVVQAKIPLVDQASVLIARCRYLAAHSPTGRWPKPNVRNSF